MTDMYRIRNTVSRFTYVISKPLIALVLPGLPKELRVIKKVSNNR